MSDAIEQVSVALVAIIDAAPAVLALTGRAAGDANIVAWAKDGERMIVRALPVLAYAFLDERDGPIMNTRALVFRFTAAARDAATASALAETAKDALTYNALVAAGVDAFVLTAARSQDAPPTAASSEDGGTVHRHDLDVVIVV